MDTCRFGYITEALVSMLIDTQSYNVNPCTLCSLGASERLPCQRLPALCEPSCSHRSRLYEQAARRPFIRRFLVWLWFVHPQAAISALGDWPDLHYGIL